MPWTPARTVLLTACVALCACPGGGDGGGDGPGEDVVATDTGEVGDVATPDAEDDGDDDVDDDGPDVAADEDADTDAPPPDAPAETGDAAADVSEDAEDTPPDAPPTDTGDATDDPVDAVADTGDAGESGSLELGADWREFRELGPMDTMYIEEGPQGGYHLSASLRLGGVTPDEIAYDVRARNEAGELVAAGAGTGGNGFTWNGTTWERLGIIVFLLAGVVETELHGEVLEVCAEVYSREGDAIDLRDCRTIVADCCIYL